MLAYGSRYSPLLDSIFEWPNDAIASILINAGADVNYSGNVNGAKLPVLSYAIYMGNVGIVERMLRLGADPNCERVFADGSRYSPLLDSIFEWPNDEITKLLIGAGADVNYVGFVDGVKFEVCRKNNIGAGADVNYVGFTNGVKFSVLHAAIHESNVDILKLLLSKGADPNCERVLADGNRYSPLLDSIDVCPNDVIASILINAGADVNYIGNNNGVKLPVLSTAICKGNVGIVERLLSKGADPNCERVLADGSRTSPLLGSIFEWPNDEITKLLIGAGADVNYVGFVDGVKFSVLHTAISESNVDILKLLLSKGANPCCEIVFNDGSRSSALRDCILRWPNAQIIDLLSSYMNPLPDDVRGLKVKRSGLSAQTIQKLKAAGCKVSIF